MLEVLLYVFAPSVLAIAMTHLAFQSGLRKNLSRLQGSADVLAALAKVLKEELNEKEAKRIIEKVGAEVRSRFER